MFKVIFCIQDRHDGWLVLVAGMLCILTTISAVLLLRHARHLSGPTSARRTLGAAATVGFGIWATHFVAMLGYDPGIVVGYRVPETIASLLIAIALTAVSFKLALARPTLAGFLGAGLLCGAGVAAMHYAGMTAMDLPATLRWDMAFVVASVILAIVPMVPALALAIRGRTATSGIASGALMALAILLLHFTAMAGLGLVPGTPALGNGLVVSPRVLTMTIAGGAGTLFTAMVCVLVLASQSRRALHASERDLAILVRGITDCAIYMLDVHGRVANWNSGAQRLKGYGTAEVTGLPLATFYTPEDRAADLPAQALAIAAATGKFTGEGWRVRRDGSRFWAHVTIERIADEHGRQIGFAKITRDMTRFKQDQDRLQGMADQLDAALDNMHQGLCLFDDGERLVVVNARFLEIWGLAEADCREGMALAEVVHAALAARQGGDVADERVAALCDILRRQAADADDMPVISEIDAELVMALTSRAVASGGWVTTFEDVTERRRSEQKIAHMAMHDPLTGLPNRPHFNGWLDAEIQHARHFEHRVAAVVIDLDRFKEINDTRGHAAGDLALQHLARRLVEALVDGEIAARLGGDEFAAAKRYRDEAELAAFLARIDGCFAQTFGSEASPFQLGGSIGVSVFPHDGATREQLLNNADLAMYRAKASMGERIAFYEPRMDEAARERRQVSNDLRHAIARDELYLLYQPQHDLRTGDLTGYEALLRWHHPVRGLVSPDYFIPLAEENGEIFAIGEWVLRRACTEACQWPRNLKIAVNLSGVQLVQDNLVEVVREIIVQTGLSPRRLELEITETAIIADKLRALHLLRQVKALGVSIAMDDFGTGYSSLDTLHSFPFDKIKIDKSFLLKSENNAEARAIIKAVLALGQNLAIPVLAEGVETRFHRDLLVEQGCDEAQGYFFGRPGEPPSASGQPTERQRVA